MRQCVLVRFISIHAFPQKRKTNQKDLKKNIGIVRGALYLATDRITHAAQMNSKSYLSVTTLCLAPTAGNPILLSLTADHPRFERWSPEKSIGPPVQQSHPCWLMVGFAKKEWMQKNYNSHIKLGLAGMTLIYSALYYWNRDGWKWSEVKSIFMPKKGTGDIKVTKNIAFDGTASGSLAMCCRSRRPPKPTDSPHRQNDSIPVKP